MENMTAPAALAAKPLSPGDADRIKEAMLSASRDGNELKGLAEELIAVFRQIDAATVPVASSAE